LPLFVGIRLLPYTRLKADEPADLADISRGPRNAEVVERQPHQLEGLEMARASNFSNNLKIKD
jgi:hypothetical protein